MEKKDNYQIYNPKIIEEEIINFWEKEYKKLDVSKITKKTFTILLPPPNVTGSLHLGHALNGYIQDVMIRWNKLNNKETIWIPGFDHAGIATEILVKRWINNNKFVINNEEDRKYFFDEWTNKQKNNIRNQWKRLGFSLNYEFESFTLDSSFRKNVTSSFIKLFNDGLIYQDKKIVNWDPILKTAISDIEVIRRKIKTKLYFFKYYLKNNKEKFIPVATTRPETMYVDQAIMVSEKDERYKDWIGKLVVNPLTEEEIPVIINNEIDINFGSGAVKCTPGHDEFDFKIGKINNLKIITCFDKEGKMTIKNQFKGIDRFKARERIVKKLIEKNALIKMQSHISNIPFSSRTDARIEPYITKQWFISTKKWKKELEEKQNEISFFPNKYNKIIWKWLDHLQDWCISRQLNWGHKIPVFFNKKTNEIKVSDKDLGPEWEQSKDVLDTWFSSALWSLTNYGWNNDERIDFEKLLPIDCLVTSYDIIFFWVTRMLFLHNHFKKKIPFKKILIHGLVRTEKGKKMSKSKNNVINPLELVEHFGSDALRLYLIGQHRIGQDLRYSKEKLIYSSQILNKLWNVNKFILKDLLELTNEFDPQKNKEEHNIWIYQEFIKIYKNSRNNFDNYLFSPIVKEIVGFIYRMFSNNYLRIVWALSVHSEKTKETILTMKWIWKSILILIHPFAPFLSEKLFLDSFKKTIINEIFDIKLNFEFKKTELIDKLNEIIKAGRIEQKETETEYFRIIIYTKDKEKWNKNFEKLNRMLLPFKLKLDKVYSCELEKIVAKPSSYSKKKYLKKDLKVEKEFLFKEIERVKKILNNKSFIEKAKPEIVLKEQKKLKYYNEKLNKIKNKV